MPSTFEFIELPYTQFTEKRFAPLANQPGALWLDSANHTQGQFDVMSAHPMATLTMDANGQYELSGLGAKEAHEALVRQHQSQQEAEQTRAPYQATQAFKLIRSLRRAFFGHEHTVQKEVSSMPAEVQRWLPGVMGLLSYTLGAVDQGVKRDKHWPALHLGFYAWLAVYDHAQGKAWLIVHKALLAPLRTQLEALFTEFKTPLDDNIDNNNRNDLNNAAYKTGVNPEALKAIANFNAKHPDTRYEKNFKQVKEYLRSGDCYQINLSRQLTLPFSGQAFSLYCKVRQQTQAPYSGFYNMNESQCLSFSPEHFLTLSPKGAVFSSPIKGTRPRSEDPEQDEQARKELASSEKDRAENLMIVDLLRNDLGRICEAGSITVPKLMAVESFTTVHHMVSEIRGQLRAELSAEDILSASFPGGSITGAPKIRAMQIIDDLESAPRDAFCGSLCHIGANNTLEANICIRTAMLRANTLTLWAGGGIVIDSTVESEWIETQWKINKILKALS